LCAGVVEGNGKDELGNTIGLGDGAVEVEEVGAVVVVAGGIPVEPASDNVVDGVSFAVARIVVDTTRATTRTSTASTIPIMARREISIPQTTQRNIFGSLSSVVLSSTTWATTR